MAVCRKCKINRPGLNANGICPSCVRFHGEDCIPSPYTNTYSRATSSLPPGGERKSTVGNPSETPVEQVTVPSKSESPQRKLIESSELPGSEEDCPFTEVTPARVKPAIGQEVEAFLHWSASAIKNETDCVTTEKAAVSGDKNHISPQLDIALLVNSLVRSSLPNFITGRVSFYIAGREFYSAPLVSPFQFLANPMNQYDKKAIEIRNGFGLMVGHVPRKISNNYPSRLILLRYLSDIDVSPSGHLLAKIDVYKMAEDLVRIGGIENG